MVSAVCVYLRYLWRVLAAINHSLSKIYWHGICHFAHRWWWRWQHKFELMLAYYACVCCECGLFIYVIYPKCMIQIHTQQHSGTRHGSFSLSLSLSIYSLECVYAQMFYTIFIIFVVFFLYHITFGFCEYHKWRRTDMPRTNGSDYDDLLSFPGKLRRILFRQTIAGLPINIMIR